MLIPPLRHVMAAVLTAAACSVASAQDQDCPRPLASPEVAAFYGARRAGADTLIVFVHGGNSNTTAAFTYRGPGGDVFWPCLVKNDPAFARADVFLYDYDSSKRSGDARNGADEAAAMASDLGGYLAGASSYRYVAFVAHSLGGLIVRRLLFGTPGHPAPGPGRVPFALLLGSPADGINVRDDGMVSVLTRVLSVPGQAQVKDFHTGSAFLGALRADWLAYRGRDARARLFCAAEDQDKPLHLAASSTLSQCDRCASLAGRDHHAIAKPENADAAPHALLRQAWRATLAGAAPEDPALFTAPCFDATP